MRLQELHLKNFGKFTDRHIYFSEHIQVFYGENEYGKSTIYAFIKAMLFGLERGRGRAAANDEFSRYEPWENPNYYAGVLRFSCGGRSFRLERQFDRYSKTVSLVCEDDGEELSVEDGDLEMLLGGMTASSFENTAAIGQLTAQPGQGLAAELKNYAANYYETGGSDVDLQGALDVLREKRKCFEQELKRQRESCEKKMEKLEVQKHYVEADLKQLEIELHEAETVSERLEQERQESVRIECEIKRQSSQRRNRKEPEELGSTNPGALTVAVGSVLAVLGAVLFLTSWFSGHAATALILAAVCMAAGIAAIAWGMLKRRQRGVYQQHADVGKDAEEETGNFDEQESAHDLRIRIQELQWEIARIKEEMKEKQLRRNNLQEQILEMEVSDEKDRQLREKLRAVNLAVSKIQEAAEDMVHQFGDRLNREASQILCELTNGKYTRLFIDEQLNMTVLSDGRRVPIDRLSRGTIEQIYFSLRMAALSILYEEEVPVILDDAFVFYDEKRLKSALKWLSEQPRQVIIFSCQTREKQILDSL